MILILIVLGLLFPLRTVLRTLKNGIKHWFIFRCNFKNSQIFKPFWICMVIKQYAWKCEKAVFAVPWDKFLKKKFTKTSFPPVIQWAEKMYYMMFLHIYVFHMRKIKALCHTSCHPGCVVSLVSYLVSGPNSSA